MVTKRGKSLADTYEKDVELHQVDPWVTQGPDLQRETGGDWYRLLLSAALRGKAVHGANTAPSCEVLCKTDVARHPSNEFGTLHWDDSVKTYSILGKDVSDHFYVHPAYRGNITASGSILAYESGLWEPSMRRRARSSALLAAGLQVHGKTNDEACAIVSKVTAEPVDIEAVDSALIPASHLKREMVLVSKASHRVFGKGTIQRGIVWNDARLSSRSEAKNMAFDWGRFTAIARYIGEANVQNCEAFKKLARQRGIPFTVVRDSWAYISDSDYHIPQHIFADVPELDISRFRIPSLIGAFSGHEQDVMLALNRGGKYASMIPEGEAFGSYLQLMNDARSRTERRVRHEIPSSSSAREVRVEEHSLTEEQLRNRLVGGEIISEAFLTAIASIRQSDEAFDRLLTTIVRDDEEGDGANDDEVDEASRIMYDRPTWVIARSIAESTLVETSEGGSDDRSQILDRITSRLSALKSNIIGYKTHLTTVVYLSGLRLERLRPQTIINAKRSSHDLAHVTYSQRSLASSQLRSAASALSRISGAEAHLLQKLRDEVAPIYDRWYIQTTETDDVGIRENLVYHAFMQAFLYGITSNICLQRATGYIEGTEPRRSYVYQGILRTATDYGFEPPRLQRFVYTSAAQLADEYDQSRVVPYSVRRAVERVIEMANLVVGDLMLGRLWTPDPDTYANECEEYGRPLSPGYDDASLREAEDEARLEAIMFGFEESHISAFTRSYEDCLRSFPNKKVADEIARANGYPDLKAAYEMHGIDFYYNETNPFVIKATTAMGIARVEAGEEDKAEEYVRKRKYDAIM